MAKRNSLRSKTSSPSDAFWILAALALWCLSCLPSGWKQISGFLLAMAFFQIRFPGFRSLLFWSLLGAGFFLSSALQKPQAPDPGVYRIAAIRSGYALAVCGKQKAVVYSPEDFDLDQRVELSDFRPVHSLNNPGLFSFSSWLKEQGIECSADSVKPASDQPMSVRRQLWRWIDEHPNRSLYRLLFYGLSDWDSLEWISALGLPLIALVGTLRSLLERFVYQEWAAWTVTGIQLILLVLFPVRDSSLRLLAFTASSLAFRRWSLRWPAGMLLFLMLAPDSGRSMSLVLPAGFSFFSHFQNGSLQKKVIQISWCALIQISCLGSLNLLLLFGFSGFRKALGWFFLLALPGLWIAGWAASAQSILQTAALSMDWCTLQGAPPFWYLAGFGLLFWMLLWSWTSKRMTALLAVLCLYPFAWRLDPFFHVYQLDVGQGDAAVIVEPFMKSAVMIDAAGRFNHDNADELFVPFFEKRQISQLDALIISHSDFDHAGAAGSVLSRIQVRQLITAGNQPVLLNYPFECLLPERPSSLPNGMAAADVLDETAGSETEDPNSLSLICAFGYDGFRYLYTGDAPQVIEQQLIERYALRSDVLKLGHHGSKTSSSEAFLKEVDPGLALISSGFQNRYGHPDSEVLSRLDRLGIDRLNTADHGAVHLFSLGPVLWIRTESGLLSCLSR